MEILATAADVLTAGVVALAAEPGRIVMMLVGCILMDLGIKKEYEPTLLVPMGLGTILVNIPFSGVIGEAGPFQILFDMGIETELFPLLLFIGIGAMIDFGPLLSSPFLLIFGAAAQFGIFFVIIVATLLGFDVADAASTGIIAAADGPTSIFVANSLGSKYMGAIMVAAYSYMALVPIIQPFAIKLCTSEKERRIRMAYNRVRSRRPRRSSSRSPSASSPASSRRRRSRSWASSCSATCCASAACSTRSPSRRRTSS